MQKQKRGEDRQIALIVNSAREKVKARHFLEFAKEVAANDIHPLRGYINVYPALPFAIEEQELSIITALLDFPPRIPEDHQWTPLEKIMYATLWKDGKLKSIGRIIEGLEAVHRGKPSKPGSAVVYHQ